MSGLGSDRPRILLVTKNDFRSERDGGSKRTAAVVRELEKAGFAVDFVAVRPTVAASAIADLYPSVMRALLPTLRMLWATLRSLSLSTLKWFSFSAIRRIVAAQAAREYSLIVVEHTQLYAYRRLFAGPAVLNMHNVESELLSNFASSATSRASKYVAKFESERMRRIESRVPAHFDIVAVVSPRDADVIVNGWNATNPAWQDLLVVAPNGVDDEYFESQREPGRNVVFIAHLGWRPNVDAAVWLAEKVWPVCRPLPSGGHLQLVGRSPSDRVMRLAAPDVDVIGDVPSVLPYLRQAAVATAPLLAAGGTRIKILEAMAAGVPVVATRLGALGLEHLEGTALALADTPEDFARELTRMASSAQNADDIRKLVEPYRWRVALRPLVERIRRAAGAGA